MDYSCLQLLSSGKVKASHSHTWDGGSTWIRKFSLEQKIMENNVVGLIVLWKQMINNILIPLTPSRHHFQLWLLVSGFKWTDENQLRHLQSWSFTFCGSDSPSSAAAAAAASFSSISFSTWWKEKEKLPSGEKKRLQPVSWFSTATTLTSLHFLVIVGSNLSLKIKVVQNKRTD